MIDRVFLIVLDSFGIGNAPDAEKFGDLGANTLGRISASSCFSAQNLEALGLGAIDGVDSPDRGIPKAAVARLTELSCGKDTTTGHWEIAGLISEHPMPTYPNGFPDEVIQKFEAAVGRGVLCNKPYSGTDVIRDYGDEHVRHGDLIVYTSADSVFQIAAHEDVVPPAKLYRICECAREILVGEHAVGRVIARPFVGSTGNYKRTANRRDFSLKPPRKTALDALKSAGLDVLAVGKISDIFAGEGVTRHFPTHSNREGMECAEALLSEDFRGLCFVNLVDFDSMYGHRQDIHGYAGAIADFDRWLGDFLPKMGENDLIMITADHGCDPGDDSTDHTRECVPLIIYGDKVKAGNLGTLSGFGHIAATLCSIFNVEFSSEGGVSLWNRIKL